MTRDCTLIEVCKLTDSQIVITIAIAKRYNGKTIFYLYSKQSKLKLPLIHSKSTANSCSTVSKFNQNPQSQTL